MTYVVDGTVATLTLDHPETRNALTADALRDLGTGLERAAHDSSVRVVILTNTGPAFCAGADLKARSPYTVRTTEVPYTLRDLIELIEQCPKPVVGRIAGHCLGGGVGLAAACDISIATEGSLFGFPEVRVGLVPSVVAVVTLAKVRRADALRLFLTGERIPATGAAGMGLITEAVTPDRLDQAVTDVVGALLQGGPLALTAIKQLANTVPALNRDDAYSWASQRAGEVFSSEEALAGRAAFQDKRPAPWVP